MCGLAGLLAPSRIAAVDCIDAMTDALTHRGPDDRGVWTERFASAGAEYAVALGHRRLSIIDLSPGGHQPMFDAAGTLAVVYNGEIYNYRELRDELQRGGARFRSESDTEVLLAGYQAWGDAFVARLDGMFAIALFDRARGRLLLARDRLGIKPLALYERDGALLFASDFTAIRKHPLSRAEIEPAAVASYLQHGYVAGPAAIYRGGRKLQPGELAVWERGALAVRRYWPARPLGARDGAPLGFDAAVRELERRLGDAVERQMISDVPLGAFLSGGIDSSTVVALMVERAGKRVRTFSIGFDEPAFDESGHARAVAQHLGTDHTELTVRVAEATDVARQLPLLYDEPFADASAVPTTLLSRLTRERVTVSLSGDGGDELFGGYRQYRRLAQLAPWLRAPLPLRRLAAGAAAILPRGSLRNGARHLGARDARELALRLVSSLDDALVARASRSAREAREYRAAFASCAADSDVQRAMAADAATYLPDDILTKVDRASMSVALEARVPLLAHPVVELAFQLPLSVIWHGGRTKAPLRAVLERHVPRALFERPKQGFALPLGRLLGRDLDAWTARYLAPARVAEDGFLDPQATAEILAEARARGGEQAEDLRFRLVSLARWFAVNVRGETLA
jgi:asparagine synthase (glutamine-hydrolysing)